MGDNCLFLFKVTFRYQNLNLFGQVWSYILGVIRLKTLDDNVWSWSYIHLYHLHYHQADYLLWIRGSHSRSSDHRLQMTNACQRFQTYLETASQINKKQICPKLFIPHQDFETSLFGLWQRKITAELFWDQSEVNPLRYGASLMLVPHVSTLIELFLAFSCLGGT